MKLRHQSSYASGKKPQVNRRNPLTAYWMAEEIFLHDCRLVFPDWSHLAHRGMERIRRDDAAHYQRRREAALAQKKEYRQRPEVKAAHAKRQRDKKSNDPGFRVKRNLSRRLAELMSDETAPKAGRPVLEIIGCSKAELRKHLERQFQNGMSWENYGAYWHVDHILPCASFDHSDSQQVLKCWHWTNLRPLSAEDNAAKKDKITEPQMALILPFH